MRMITMRMKRDEYFENWYYRELSDYIYMQNYDYYIEFSINSSSEIFVYKYNINNLKLLIGMGYDNLRKINSRYNVRIGIPSRTKQQQGYPYLAPISVRLNTLVANKVSARCFLDAVKYIFDIVAYN